MVLMETLDSVIQRRVEASQGQDQLGDWVFGRKRGLLVCVRQLEVERPRAGLWSFCPAE
jgi:hypothetical protein